MVSKSIYVELHAKPGKEAEVAAFLKSGLAVVNEEPGTINWYALKLDESRFGIFDTFNDDKGRDAHLAGRLAAALMSKAGELLSKPPQIMKADVLAAK